jgi:hypothetical protein
MKTKNISILLFILLVSGVVLLASTQVMAGPGCACGPGELGCIMIDNDYALRISPDVNGQWPILCDPTNPGVDYCKLDDQTEEYLDWRWEVCTTVNNCKKNAPLTWGYFIHRIQTGVVPHIIASDPTGAKLVLPGDPNSCPLATADANHVLWKLNPSVNCQSALGTVRFSMYTTTSLAKGVCNFSAATLKNYCDGDFMWGPVVEAESFAGGLDISTADGSSTLVALDRCSYEPEEVIFDDGAPASDGNNAWICFGAPADYDGDNDPETGTVCYEINNAGLRETGCNFRIPRLYLHGDKTFWKGEQPPADWTK